MGISEQLVLRQPSTVTGARNFACNQLLSKAVIRKTENIIAP